MSVRPDKATLNLQVRTKGKEAKLAQTKNAKEMTRVEKVLKDEFRIEAKDIQTTNFSLQPEYRYEQNGKQVFLGYQLEHGLSVTVRKLESVGTLLDALVGKGTEDVAVLLQGVNFATEKRQEVELQALDLAMKNALSRAEALAKSSKRSLKGVLRISDSSVQHQPPVYAHAPMAMMKGGAEMADSTSVAPGEINISSRVSVEYEMQ